MFKLSNLLLILLAAVSSSAQVGTWTDIPVLTEIRNIYPSGDEIFLATDGGVYTFYNGDGSFKQGVRGEITKNLDVTALYIDNDSLLWVGARSPGPIVEVIDLKDGSHVPVEFVNLDQVTSFTQVGDSVFATFTDGLEGGLLLYRKGDTKVEYLDQFNQFPNSAAMKLDRATDVYRLENTLAFRTQRFILWSQLGETNMKDPQNWNYTVIPNSRSSINRMHTRDSLLLLAIDNYLYSYDLSSFQEIYSAGANIIDVLPGSGISDSIIFATNSAVYLYESSNGSATPLHNISGIQNLSGTSESIWIGSKVEFLSQIIAGNILSHSANRPRDHVFNRMVINNNGDLVAGARGGLSMLTERGWRTVIASNTSGEFNTSLYNWDAMITDTLAYVGSAIIEDMLKDLDGNIYLALQGRGVLRVDGDLSGESTFFTVASNVLEPTFDSETYILSGQMAVDSENNVFLTNKLIRDGGSSVTIITADDSVYHIDHNLDALNSRTVKSIAIDHNDLIWTGSQIRAELQATGGIHLIGRDGLFENNPREVSFLSGSPLASNEILQLEVDDQNILWILTTSGVQSMQLPQEWLSSSELRNWANLYMTDTYWQLTDFNVTGIEIDQRGNRWFLSSNAGVHVYQQNGRWINDGYGYSTNNSDLSDNTVYAIAFNNQSGETYMSTAKGISILKTPFADPKPDYSEMHIYPQPFNPDKHHQVIVQGLMDNSSIKILTVSGALVRELNAEEGEVLGYEAQWDGLNESGKSVGSGVYLLYIFNEDGTSASQKIAIVR